MLGLSYFMLRDLKFNVHWEIISWQREMTISLAVIKEAKFQNLSGIW